MICREKVLNSEAQADQSTYSSYSSLLMLSFEGIYFERMEYINSIMYIAGSFVIDMRTQVYKNGTPQTRSSFQNYSISRSHSLYHKF